MIDQPHKIAEGVARRSYGKLVAFLAVRTHDVAAAEDALADAFASALNDWPINGCPDNPEAWLLTVARRRIIDSFRRAATAEASSETVQLMSAELDSAAAVEIPDRRLALMFVCAHPAIDESIRAALMLQVVLGLDAKTIASAFLVSPAALSKRLVRAKSKIRQARIPFNIPDRDELAPRLNQVLDGIYASFNEAWSDPGGTDPVRHDLADEAIFLARLVSQLLPQEPEALGLLSLILHAEARRHARRNEAGDYVPLAQQDMELWNWPMIEEAESLLRRATAFQTLGRYQLEAALQSAHVYRCRTGKPNWDDVLQLYDLLLALTGSPIVAINRASTITELSGASAGLAALMEIEDDARLAEYQPYWATRADLLARTGATDEARQSYEMAIGLERNPAVRRFLHQKLLALEGGRPNC